ncbi:hypothetical protein ILYODFUR_018570 [Ilyodon furcidens]|uniref:Uncharacterized protein n=1 Tax=Ilyodon furcidens TaxID=33524 RepID=A0ABV0T1V9_9TELE
MFALIELYSDRRNKRKMDEVSEPLFTSAFNNTIASCLILLNQSVCLPQGSFTSQSVSLSLFHSFPTGGIISFSFFFGGLSETVSFQFWPRSLIFLDGSLLGFETRLDRKEKHS